MLYLAPLKRSLTEVQKLCSVLHQFVPNDVAIMAILSEPAGSSAHPPIAVGSATRLISVLQNAIDTGMYQLYERLPAERNLAEQYGASRGTVREALKYLEDRGLVTRKAGSGTFVNFRSDSTEGCVAKATSPLELIDVRLGIETQIVRLAVSNANAHDLDKLETTLHRVEHSSDDPELFGEADSAFHLALADCTQNPLMKWLYWQLNTIRGHRQWSVVKDKVLNRERIECYNQQHRSLFEAIEARDMDVALATIIEHLEKARAHLLGAPLAV